MLERQFANDVEVCESEARRSRLIGRIGAVVTLGFWRNQNGIERTERNAKTALDDLAALRRTVSGMDEMQRRLAAFRNVNGVRVSVCAFPDMELDGKQTYGPEWDRLRDHILLRDSYECQHGNTGFCAGPLQIHHVRWLSQGGTNVAANLVTLCRRHHGLQHPGNAAFIGD